MHQSVFSVVNYVSLRAIAMDKVGRLLTNVVINTREEVGKTKKR
jgi:hypothetical protein